MHATHNPRMSKHSIHWAMTSLICGCSEVGEQHGGHKACGQLVPNPNHSHHQWHPRTPGTPTSLTNNIRGHHGHQQRRTPRRFRNHSSLNKLNAAAKTELTTGMHMALPRTPRTSATSNHFKRHGLQWTPLLVLPPRPPVGALPRADEAGGQPSVEEWGYPHSLPCAGPAPPSAWQT